MNASQWGLLEMIAMLGAPVIFSAAATATFWRSINHRALFSVFALLSMWGLASLIFPIAQDLVNPSGAGSAVFPGAQFNVLVAYVAGVALCGLPLLLWLRNVLRRT